MGIRRHCPNCRIATTLLAALAVVASGAVSVQAEPRLPERPLFRTFNSAHGLPSDTVHQLAIDADRNLWIATLDGLARFDGVEFRVWRHDPAVSGSLPQNDIQVVRVDEFDRLWIAIQDGGVGRYRHESEDFEFWRHDPDDPASLSTDRVWALHPDGEGGMWAGGFRGLMRIRADDSVQRLELPAGHGCSDIVLALARTEPDQQLWISTTDGLCRYHERDGFSPVAWSEAEAAAGLMVQSMRVEGGQLWLSSNRGLRVLPLHADAAATMPQIPPMLADTSGAATLFEPDGTLWYASLDGIRRWQRGSGETTLFPARPGRLLALQAHRFQHLLRDHEGSLWFASYGGGLAQLLPKWRAIRVYLKDADDPDGLPGGDIFQLGAGGADRLWVTFSGDGGGVSEIDLGSGRVRQHFADGDGVTQPDAHVLTALRDREGCIWTSHLDHFSRYCERIRQFHRIDHDQAGRVVGNRPWRLSEAPDGSISVAFGVGGLGRIDPRALRLHFDPLGAADGLSCAQISGFAYDDDGGSWMSCERGIVYAAPDQTAVRMVAGVPPTRIDGLGFDRQGQLWLHAGDRLQQYRRERDTLHLLRSVGRDQGWPAVRAGGLYVDADGVVWMTSMRGLYAYDPDHDRIVHYDQNDGLPSAEFSRRAPPIRLDDHRFAAATVTGLVVIDSQALHAVSLPAPTLRWHSAQAQHGARRIQLPLDGRTVRLDHNHRELRLAVRLDSLVKPSAHRYRFRLEGYDPDWIELHGQPERVIERLPSGRHLLEVEAAGSDGQPARNRLRLEFQVEPPPWRQPWAFALYAAALIGLLAVILQSYRRRLRRRHTLALAEERRHWAEQASLAKTRFLASIGHEIRTPMAGMLGMNALLLDSPLDDRQRHYARSVNKAAEHMLALINDLLDLSRIEAGRLDLEPADLNLAELVDGLIDEAGAAAEAKGLALSARIEPGVPLAVQADGKRLTQILLNFINNAIKFTPEGRVRLLLEYDGERHCFAVQDDGPGLSPQIRERLFERYNQDARGRSSGGSGLGLAIAGELALLMSGEVGADDGEGGGSRFWLRVQLPARDRRTIVDGSGLPPLLIVDPVRQRGEDLAASLTALGANVDVGDPVLIQASSIGKRTIVLLAANAAAEAEAELQRYRLSDQNIVLSLPLAAPLPVANARRRTLSGPWRPLATLAACHALAAPSAQPASTDSAPETRLDGMTLLLVEDDPLLSEVWSARLTALGADLHAVDNGLLALAAVEQDRFDAILLDLDLPELDGLQFLSLMRQRLGPLSPPVIVITARQHPGDEAQSLAAGAQAFYRKPVEVETLARRLRRL